MDYLAANNRCLGWRYVSWDRNEPYLGGNCALQSIEKGPGVTPEFRQLSLHPACDLFFDVHGVQ